MPKNTYIHIPFCRQKCRYCSFVSYVQEELKEPYLNALTSEIKHFYAREPLDTLYFGGGTPSILSADEFSKILNLFNITTQTEVTAELNPECLSQQYLNNLKAAQINRLSLGCQTFNDEILRIIGRKHSSYEVKNAVDMAFEAGFDNVSLDFIYGLPSQTTRMFENDLRQAISLGIQHISLYGLKIEKGCYFANRMPENLPDEDSQADMYLKALEVLTNAGFEHYEISNFSKKNYHSRHNLNYWNNNTYYGFGIAAHGFVDNVRYENVCNFKQYFKNPQNHLNIHILSPQESLEEEIFLGFRKRTGICVDDINQKFGIDFEDKYSDILGKFISSSHLEKINGNYRLTNNGILVSNVVLAEFLV